MSQRVPGFSFTSGNAGKFLATPLYLLGGLASFVVPRKHSLWAFGSGSGVGEGALALAQYARKANPDLELVWLARNADEIGAARALGIRAVRKSSLRGFVATLRAELIAITHGFGDANRFATRGAFVVQLWHGIPLKHIALDSEATFRGGPLTRSRLGQWMLRRAYARTARSIGLFPAASALSADRLRGAFGLPAETVAITGDPRDDVLATAGSDSTETRAGLAKVLGVRLASRVVLYAPTWRDGEIDPAIPTADEWAAIDHWLSRARATLIVRPHPHGVGDYAAGPRSSERIHLLDSTLQGDITPLLPAFDSLITDYSSIAFDFALLGRPIAFLAPDVEHYVATRGLYEPYSEFSGGAEVASWPEVLQLLTSLDADPLFAARLRRHSAQLAEKHHAFRDGRNTDRVYSEIVTRLKERE